MEVYFDNDFKSKEFWGENGGFPQGEFDVITETVGKTTMHQVYEEGELDACVCDEFLNHYGGYLGYLLSLVHDENGRKCSFTWCKHKYDANAEEIVPFGFRITVSGNYKNGVYKITIDDDNMRWFDEDGDCGA